MPASSSGRTCEQQQVGWNARATRRGWVGGNCNRKMGFEERSLCQYSYFTVSSTDWIRLYGIVPVFGQVTLFGLFSGGTVCAQNLPEKLHSVLVPFHGIQGVSPDVVRAGEIHDLLHIGHFRH